MDGSLESFGFVDQKCTKEIRGPKISKIVLYVERLFFIDGSFIYVP